MSSTTLEMHINRDHLGLKPFKCKHCDKTFTSQGICTVHEQMDHTEYNGKAQCNICKKQFAAAGECRTHCSKIRKGGPYSCKTCNRFFHARFELNHHMIDHVKLTCITCGLEFEGRRELDSHVINQHKVHKCNICDYQCATKLHI